MLALRHHLPAVMTVPPMLSKASARGRRSRGCRQSKGGGEIPPSIASLPSLTDPREQQLEQIIRNLPLKKGGEDTSAADARALLEVYTLASVARPQQKKLGAASPITVARDLKLIASRSSTLLKLLKRADGNTFKAWAAVPYPEAVAFEMAREEWLQLKNLLDVAVQR